MATTFTIVKAHVWKMLMAMASVMRTKSVVVLMSLPAISRQRQQMTMAVAPIQLQVWTVKAIASLTQMMMVCATSLRSMAVTTPLHATTIHRLQRMTAHAIT